jgi:hypothetical protein
MVVQEGLMTTRRTRWLLIATFLVAALAGACNPSGGGAGGGVTASPAASPATSPAAQPSPSGGDSGAPKSDY